MCGKCIPAMRHAGMLLVAGEKQVCSQKFLKVAQANARDHLLEGSF